MMTEMICATPMLGHHKPKDEAPHQRIQHEENGPNDAFRGFKIHRDTLPCIIGKDKRNKEGELKEGELKDIPAI